MTIEDFVSGLTVQKIKETYKCEHPDRLSQLLQPVIQLIQEEQAQLYQAKVNELEQKEDDDLVGELKIRFEGETNKRISDLKNDAIRLLSESSDTEIVKAFKDLQRLDELSRESAELKQDIAKHIATINEISWKNEQDDEARSLSFRKAKYYLLNIGKAAILALGIGLILAGLAFFALPLSLLVPFGAIEAGVLAIVVFFQLPKPSEPRDSGTPILSAQERKDNQLALDQAEAAIKEMAPKKEACFNEINEIIRASGVSSVEDEPNHFSSPLHNDTNQSRRPHLAQMLFAVGRH